MVETPSLSATLIGDLTDPAGAAPQGADPVRALRAAIAAVNRTLRPVVALRTTTGTEYQGAFTSVGEALRATLLLRLALLPAADLRHGVGWGEIAAPARQDDGGTGADGAATALRIERGPGWWAARDALTAVEKDQERSALDWRRTGYQRDASASGPAAEPVNAALLLRDQLVGGLDRTSLTVLRGLLSGTPRQRLAEQTGLAESALDARIRDHGLTALLASDEALGRTGG